ncbi:MAG: two-component system regulatory protein YycI [Bacillota bacterium]
MDWGRAKTILIAAFLILDLLLIWELAERRSVLEEGFMTAAEELEQRMRQAGVEQATDVPADIPEGWVLTVELLPIQPPENVEGTLTPSQRQPNQWTVHLRRPYPLVKNSSRAAEPLPELPPDLVYQARQYMPDPWLSSEQRWRYVQTVRGVPLFHVGLELELENGYVRRYHQSWAVVRKREPAPPLISAATAVYSLLDKQYLSAETILQDVRFGYYGRIYDADEQVLNPVWRVVYDERGPGGRQRHVLFVNAITGSLELEEQKAAMQTQTSQRPPSERSE